MNYKDERTIINQKPNIMTNKQYNSLIDLAIIEEFGNKMMYRISKHYCKNEILKKDDFFKYGKQELKKLKIKWGVKRK